MSCFTLKLDSQRHFRCSREASRHESSPAFCGSVALLCPPQLMLTRPFDSAVSHPLEFQSFSHMILNILPPHLDTEHMFTMQ